MLPFTLSYATASSESESRADYLDLEVPYTLSDASPLESFINELNSLSETINLDKSITPDETLSCAYISLAASKSHLIEFGTFPYFESTDELKTFLIDVNKFETVKSNSKASVGDVVICNSVPGIITKDTKVIFISKDGQLISYKLDALKNAQIIHVVYPKYEVLSFLYMTNELGYNRPKVCGILANIHCESLSNPTIEERSNQMGYGICQWSKDRRILFNLYCEKNNLDPDFLYTQLDYMDKELKEDFGDLDYALNKTLTNDGDGAYDSAVYFCFNFENPNEATDASIERGELAQETIWPIYGGLTVEK